MEIETRQIGAWVVRQRTPNHPPPHALVLLLHGWTGDEKAMWIFAPRLPKNALLVAPRGLYPTPLGGFGWSPRVDVKWLSIEDLQPAVEALRALLKSENFPSAYLGQIHLVGFSQGAALAYAFSLINPSQVGAVAGLSGFMPEHAGKLIDSKPLSGKPVFVAHGTRDELVPVEMARQAVRILQTAGADVSYCEDDVGHKLSLTCFDSLEHFSALHCSV